MRRVLTGIATALVLGLGMTGCDLNPASNDDEVTITLGDIAGIAAGTTQDVTATVKGNVAIESIVFKIYDSNDQDVTTSMFTVSQQNITLGAVEKVEIGVGKDMYYKITPKATVCNETYTLKVTATAGSASLTKPDDFQVTGGTCGTVEDTLKVKDVTVGNQNATAGSALDVDAMVVYSSADCNSSSATQALIDAWFGIVGGSATVLAPASANGFAPITKNWTVKNATKFLKVTATFDAIKKQSQIDALWSGTGSNSLSIATGDVIVVQTATGVFRLLQIVSASNAENGTVSVTGRIK